MAALPLESWLEVGAGSLRVVLEFISVVCVGIGLLVTLRQSLRLRLRRRVGARPFNRIRLTFGSWLSMALEFQLAADIVSTTTAPSNENLIKLAVVAVIRTFLNVFLAREVEAEQKFEDEHRQSAERRSADGELPPSRPSGSGASLPFEAQ
ncbi:conserved hypothetical protein [Cyanobium sp. PCC 7001]|uniref:DUF1622 domain-containing protein n=1 Tax=Cyanobium sp. PCC 7001 TaxID=180281 RepID=UPI0001804ECA|nr:DUF1622 domain-containing protein [Cyanobium sp. PCC 7001]EDY39302.1 conserved hypothetical protein [Cyanobium sp. PCC 7001]